MNDNYDNPLAYEQIEIQQKRIKQLELSGNDLFERLQEVIAERDKLKDTFRHYHVNAKDRTDTCKKCGLDLRNSIHMRIGG